MRYELWARSRESGVFEFQDSFTDEKEKYYRLDTVDTELYKEAMVLITDINKTPVLDLYVDLSKKISNKIYKEENRDEFIREHTK